MASYTIASTMEAWASQDRRSREHAFAIQRALKDIRSGYSFQRRAGLQKLLATLCVMDAATADAALAPFNISRDVSRAVFPQGTVTAVPSHPLCAVTWRERVLGLSILQGLCTLSPHECEHQLQNTHVLEAACDIVVTGCRAALTPSYVTAAVVGASPPAHLWAAMDYLEAVLNRRPRALQSLGGDDVVAGALAVVCCVTAGAAARVRAVEFLVVVAATARKGDGLWGPLEAAVIAKCGPKWGAAVMTGSLGFVLQSVALDDAMKASHYEPLLKAVATA